MAMKVRSILLILVLILLLVESCGKDRDLIGVNKPEKHKIIISDSTYIVPENDSLELVSKLDSVLVFEYVGLPPNIRAGNIIIGTDGGGFLRKVTDVDTTSGDRIIIYTSEASLVDAVECGSFDTTYSLSISDESFSINGRNNSIQNMDLFYAAPGVSLTPNGISLSNLFLYSGNVGNSSLEVKVIDGIIAFEPQINIGGDIYDGVLKEFHAVATGKLDFNACIGVKVSNTVEFSHEINLASFQHICLQFVGPVPIVEVIILSFDAGFELNATDFQELQTGFNSSFKLEVGAEYKDGIWSSVFEPDHNFEIIPITWESNSGISITGYIKTRLSVIELCSLWWICN